MTTHCRECYAQIPPTARTGCCETCRPVRRHSEQRARSVADARQHRRATEAQTRYRRNLI